MAGLLFPETGEKASRGHLLQILFSPFFIFPSSSFFFFFNTDFREGGFHIRVHLPLPTYGHPERHGELPEEKGPQRLILMLKRIFHWLQGEDNSRARCASKGRGSSLSPLPTAHPSVLPTERERKDTLPIPGRCCSLHPGSLRLCIFAIKIPSRRYLIFNN